MNQEQQINEWAHMLDEAMEDKAAGKKIDLALAGGTVLPSGDIQLDADKLARLDPRFVDLSRLAAYSPMLYNGKWHAWEIDRNPYHTRPQYMRLDAKGFDTEDQAIDHMHWLHDRNISEVDLSQREGSMANIIRNQIIQTDALNRCVTKQQVYDLVRSVFEKNKLDTPASRRLLFNIMHSRDLTSAMYTVINSYDSGASIGVNGPTRRFRREMYEDEPIDERRMDGPASAAKGGKDEIAEFRQMLDSGVVEFNFRKADGSLRHAVGTTSEAVVPTVDRERLDPEYKTNLESYQRRMAYIIWFWDLEKNACRCFNTNRFEGLVKFEPTDKRIDNNVAKVGDIFIHKDVDAGMEDPNKVTPEKAEAMYNDIGDELAAGAGDIAGILVGGGFAGTEAFREIKVETGPNGEPILKMVIRKRGTDADQPYPLRINDLRKAILAKYGVNVKKVVVDGEFQF